MLLQDERAKGFASAKLERRAEHDPEVGSRFSADIMLKRTNEIMILLRRIMI
jgi:hypothetical protein